MRVDPATFELRYRADPDPWRFATSPYERAKYQTTVAHLATNYRRCFEPGCSVGVLTRLLATRAKRVIACEASPTAIAIARARLADLAAVRVIAAAVPDWWPPGAFDLIVFSELCYYWDEPGLSQLIHRAVASLEHGGALLAVHWLGRSADHLLSGLDVHAIFQSHLGPPDVSYLDQAGATPSDAGFVLERWRMP